MTLVKRINIHIAISVKFKVLSSEWNAMQREQTVKLLKYQRRLNTSMKAFKTDILMVIVAWTRSSSCCSRTTTGQCATTARHRHTQHLMRESLHSNEREIWNEIHEDFIQIFEIFYCIPSFRALSFFFIHFHHLFHLFFFAATEREMVYASN